MKTFYQSLLLAIGALALAGTSIAQVPSTNDTSDTTSRTTAGGFGAIKASSTGTDNTAYGFEPLNYNTNGSYNSVFGEGSGSHNTTGSYNTAVGYWALYQNQVGVENTAIGDEALNSNRAGFNTAVGFQSLYENHTGKYNIALGWNAGRYVVLGSYNIEIGNEGNTSGADSDTIRIGTQGTQTATYIAGIVNGTSVTGPYVVIDTTTGQLGVSTTPPAGVKTAYVPRLQMEVRRQAAEILDLKQQVAELHDVKQQVAEVQHLKRQVAVMSAALQKLQTKDQLVAQR